MKYSIIDRRHKLWKNFWLWSKVEKVYYNYYKLVVKIKRFVWRFKKNSAISKVKPYEEDIACLLVDGNKEGITDYSDYKSGTIQKQEWCKKSGIKHIDHADVCEKCKE